MGKMEAAGESLSRIEAFKSRDSRTTLQPLPPQSGDIVEFLRQSGAPEWNIVVLQMAQDKRHDLAPHALRLWGEKLKGIPDKIICEALLAGRWQFFPSVDDVLTGIDELRERMRQEAANREWDHYKAEQRRAAAEGRMATEEDYALMREALRRCFGDPTSNPTGEPK